MKPEPRISMVLLVLLAVRVLQTSNADAGEQLSIGEFRKIHRELRPSPTEGWRTIPWKVSLLEAQRTAAKEKKPIFIWAMDGHPLGCT